MKTLTAIFILAAPPIILFVDYLVSWLSGPDDTITAVVRGWVGKSVWPEAVFLLVVLLLYLHLFRGWPPVDKLPKP